MKNTIYIEYGTKKYPVNITKSQDPDYAEIDTAIHIECKEAGFNQERDITDLTKLLEYLPDLIKEKKHKKKQGTINLRISSEEKSKIESLAKISGYKNISSYIRMKALQV